MRQLLKAHLITGYDVTQSVMKHFFKLVMQVLYSPKNTLKENNNKTNITCVKIGDSSYTVAHVKNGRIYTDRGSNISIISNQSLVPKVSWQFQEGRVLNDTENYMLSGQIQVNHHPKKVNAHLVSLLTGGGGNYNYYHWLYDCLPRLYIIHIALKLNEDIKYLIPDDTYAFQKDTLNILGIKSSSCISSKYFQHIRATYIIASSHPNPNPSDIPIWIFKFLRESFLQKLSCTNTKFIYISRSDSLNSRRLINEDFLINTLKPLGFEVYNLSDLSFSDQVSLFSRTKIVIGVHGAGFANLTFASKGTILYELFTERYQPNMYECISKLGKLKYNKIACKSVSSKRNAQIEDLFIRQNDILNILKQVETIRNFF